MCIAGIARVQAITSIIEGAELCILPIYNGKRTNACSVVQQYGSTYAIAARSGKDHTQYWGHTPARCRGVARCMLGLAARP